MRDIVETIQRDQLELVSDGRPGVLVVQGGPGTGKTAIGLHRVVWLLDPTNRGLTPDDVLVVGPHRGFLRYVSQVLPRLGSRGVATVEVSRLWDGEVRAEDTPAAHLVKSDERMAEVLRRVVDSDIRPEALASHLSDDVFSTPYKGAALTLPAAEIEALAVEARDSSGPYLVRRRKFVDTFVDRLLSRYAKALPGRRADDTLRSGIEKHGRVASLINAVWPALNAETILRRTLNDADAVHAAAPGLLTAEEREAPRTAPRGPRRRRALDPRRPASAWRSCATCCPGTSRGATGTSSWTRPGSHPHAGAFPRPPLPERFHDRARRSRPDHRRPPVRRVGTAGRDPERAGRLAPGRAQRGLSGPARGHAVRGAPGRGRVLLHRGSRVGAPPRRGVSDDRARSIRTGWRTRPSPAPWNSPRRTGGGPVDRADRPGRHHTARGDRREGRGGLGKPRDGTPPVTVLPATLAKGLEFDHVVVVEPAAIAGQGPAGPRRLYVAITRCTRSLTVVHSAPLPAVLGGPAAPTLGVPIEPTAPTLDRAG